MIYHKITSYHVVMILLDSEMNRGESLVFGLDLIQIQQIEQNSVLIFFSPNLNHNIYNPN